MFSLLSIAWSEQLSVVLKPNYLSCTKLLLRLFRFASITPGPSESKGSIPRGPQHHDPLLESHFFSSRQVYMIINTFILAWREVTRFIPKKLLLLLEIIIVL